MQGVITKGTTLRGRAVNAGELVEISEDDYQKLKMTGDIEPPEKAPEPIVESEPETESPKPKKKTKP